MLEFIKKILQHRCFLVNIAKFLRTPILKKICQPASRYNGMPQMFQVTSIANCVDVRISDFNQQTLFLTDENVMHVSDFCIFNAERITFS